MREPDTVVMTESVAPPQPTEPSVGQAEVLHDRHKLELDVLAKSKVSNKMQAFWDSEKELKAAMPTIFSPLDAKRLEAAVEVAKQNDVHIANPKMLEAAEKALADGRTKAELAASKVKKLTPEQEKKAAAAAKKQADDDLKAAMPNMFNPLYPARLKDAIEAAKAAGADPAKIEAAEFALEAALEHEDTEAKHQEYKSVVTKRKTDEAAQRKAATEEKAKVKAEADTIREAERELKVAMPDQFTPGYSAELEKAIEKAKAAGVPELPVAAAEAALQEARDHERLQASAKVAAEAKKKMEAEEKEQEKARNKAAALEKVKAKADAEALVAAEVELKAAMPTVFSPAYPAHLTEAIEEAKQAGVTIELVAEAEAALRELHRKTTPADIAADALRHAEQKLKAAMPLMFAKADTAKLQSALDQAKEAGVSPAKLAAAEAALTKALTKKVGTKAGKAGSMSSAALRAAFNKYDTNHSGKLDHKELRNAVKEVRGCH